MPSGSAGNAPVVQVDIGYSLPPIGFPDLAAEAHAPSAHG